MHPRRHRYRSPARLTFPCPEGNPFPEHEILRGYLQGLIPRSPLHPELFILIARVLEFRGFMNVLQEVFGGLEAEEEVEALLGSEDEGELVHRLEEVLSVEVFALLEEKLRTRILEALEKTSQPGNPASSYVTRRRKVCATLGLQETEYRVLEICVMYRTTTHFEGYCDCYPFTDWIALFAAALGLRPKEVSACLVEKGGLIDKRLVKMERGAIEVFEPLLQYLQGVSDDFLDRKVFSVSDGPTYALDSYPLQKRQRDLLQDAVCSPGPCHLLFYGRPGTGKTEMARSLAEVSGLIPFMVRYGTEGTGRDRRMALHATLSIAPAKALIIMDEADCLLNNFPGLQPGKVDKGWVNQFMDQCARKVIWISNTKEYVPESTLRRFDYSLEFSKFTERQRRNAWDMQLRELGMHACLPSAVVERLVRRHRVNAAGIASALTTVKRLTGEKELPSEILEAKLSEVLSQHEKLTGLRQTGKGLIPVQEQYDVQALNTDVPVERLLTGLKNRKQAIEAGGEPYPAAVLFWGVPGTGKTEFAKYVADQLEQELVCRRMSDLQSKYVGETEQRIAAAFAEAHQQDAILLLDEADSLFLERSETRFSWETSQTNELLTQMENFTGICICCTNLLDLLDGAALRRFAWKVEFRALTQEGRELLFRRFFQPKGPLAGSVRERLVELRELTPGDYKVVSQQARFDGVALTPAAAVEALGHEIRYKQRGPAPLGFCG